VTVVHALSWYFPDSIGGTEIYVRGLCRRLRDAGVDVRVAAPTPRRGVPDQYTHDGVPVFRYRVSAQPTRAEATHHVPTRGSQAFHAWLAQIRPDVLHVHSLTTGLGLHEIREARRLGIRVVMTCHLPALGYMCRAGELMQWGDVPCDGFVSPAKCAACNLTRVGLSRPAAIRLGSLPPGVSAALGRVPGRAGTAMGMAASIVDYQQKQRELFELVDRVVVLNETARAMLVSNGSPCDKVSVNRLGLSQAGVGRKPGPDERPTDTPVRFGYVGRLHTMKGLHQLASAVAAIPRSVRFHLDVRGPLLDPDAHRVVAEMRARLDGDDRVSFESAIPGEDVPATLAGLDALVCPSIGFENGPTIAIEAIAAGTPVIGSRVGNLLELIEDGTSGRLVAPRDVDALARALTEAATDPAGTIDRWRRGLPCARTMDDIARDYLELYAA
jgi:glycosyltransferase involved in cell wall biosynthesis